MLRWTNPNIAIFHKLWNDGTSIKAICAELECSAASLKAQRRKLGLSPRRPLAGARGRALTIYFSEAEYAELGRSASRRGATMAQYVRALVRRDGGGHGGSVVVHHDRGERTVIMDG